MTRRPTSPSQLTVVILTFNEERHIARAIGSIRGIAERIVVVDSGSNDRTVEIARGFGVEVLSNPWRNHATQFNWALDQLDDKTQWVLRLDADEVVSEKLADQISAAISSAPETTDGFTVGRRMCFLGRPIRHGGLFPMAILRLFRHGKGRCEDRWMDEHIMVDGDTGILTGELLDDNLNSLSWWTDKHNAYASREVVDMLNHEFQFMPIETVAGLGKGQAGLKRWLKEKVYSRSPGGLRAFLYFLYRYVLRLGFLDGREGLAFHVLQGFWYRFLVDAKLQEVRSYMDRNGSTAPQAIRAVLKIDV
ncbi:glycosyltransferase family 2 protein [Ruegeria arenilitoris]|uniref:glycosyltransferase family 2 protein n=1 Tax=Ruegeria arenilitoris TaxID=1173585 RepID=UPI00147AFF37|nr:glycosyltransferase family 2 protein [Ruegeria arenilitoris]